MSEAQKYQGALYKDNKNKRAKTTETSTPSAPKPDAPKEMAHAAYVEDVAEEYGQWRDYEYDSGDDKMSPANLPEAPTPPLQEEVNVNVFDYLVTNATPTASNVSLPRMPAQLSEETQLVRFDAEKNGMMDDMDEKMQVDALVQYGTGPVPVSSFHTPAPKGDRKKKDSDKSDQKKDKKRKRLHVDTADQNMTDAPPILHSGLTGGLNKLMRPPVFPPSPDYSGDNVAETPTSPLKKSKQHKHSKRTEGVTIGNSLMAMIAGSKTKTKKRKHSTSSTSSKTKKTREHRHKIEGPKDQKLLEYRPGSKDGKDAGGAMVLYKPRAEQFLSFVDKGPESEKGISLHKALKRYHRERSDSGQSTLSKPSEEKELWRSLRLRKNDRGEIVLFSV
jgi:cell growth-regulating nucleolar protein